MHCVSIWGQWAMEVVHYTASLPGGSGQWNSCNTPPDRLGAVGSATPARHYLTASRPWAVEEFHCPLPPDSEAAQCRGCAAHYP